MKRSFMFVSACLSLMFAATSYSSTICHQYVIKVAKQLDMCGQNAACLKGPFDHALDMKNYGTLYVDCKNTFQAAVADRLAAVPIPKLEDMEPKELALGGGDSCSNAFNFLSYATQSCKTAKCVDQQYANTIKVPAFQFCSGSLLSLREARKLSLQSPTHPAQLANWNYNAMTSQPQASN